MSTIPLMLAGLLIYSRGAAYIRNQIYREMSNTSKVVIDKTGMFMSERISNIDDWASNPYMVDMIRKIKSDSNHETLSNYLRNINRFFLDFHCILVFDQNGKLIGSSKPDYLTNAWHMESYLKEGWHDNLLKYYTHSHNQGKVFIDEAVFSSFTSEYYSYATFIAKPVIYQGEKIAYIGGFVNWGFLYSILDDMEFNNEGKYANSYVNIIDQHGNILVAPEFQRRTRIEEPISIFQNGYSKYRDFNKSLEPSETLNGETKINGKEYLFSAVKANTISHPGELEWTAVVSVSVEQALQPIRNLALLIFIIVIFFVFISILISSKLSEYISRPVSYLSNAMQKFRREEAVFFNQPPKIGSVEMKQLFESFKIMALDINHFQHEDKKRARLASIGQTAAQIAHDIRKPLASMKSFLTILPAKKDDDEFLKKFAHSVEDTINRTNTMLSEILEFSKDATTLKRENHDPQSIITAALGDSLRDKSDADVNIEYNLMHRNYLNVDGDRIIRVLTNIMGNAVEALRPDSGQAMDPSTGSGQVGKGKIWIKTEDVLGRSRVKGEGLKDEAKVEVEVEDKVEDRMKIVIGNNGPTIPENVQKKLFDPFFTKGKKGGTGLGLAICQKIVEMHGGHIEVRSYNESHVVNEAQEPKLSGQGLKDEVEAKVEAKENITEFIIELPASPGRLFINEAELIYHSSELKPFREEAAAREEYGDTANAAEFMRLHKERGRPSYLLIVDDEPLFRETVQTLLKKIPEVRDHVHVVEVGSAEEALSLFKAREFDYVIADIDMGRGKMNGYEMSRVMLEKYLNTYVLIHSNKRREEMDRNIRDAARGITPHPSPSPQRGEGGKFMGFLPKPMKQSELLQFLACKTFEVTKVAKSPAVPARKMLIVNDDPDLLLSFKIILKSPSLQVLGASNVSEAFEHLTKDHVDVILSDINLGADEPDGYEFLKKVREKDKSIPFYLISGYSRRDEEPKAKSLGANGYLQLPVDKDQLEELLQ